MSYQENVDRIIEDMENGKLIWDGKQLVTPEELAIRQQDEFIRQNKCKGGEE